MEKSRKSVLGENGIAWQPQADQIHHLTEFTYYELHPDPARKIEHEHLEAEKVIFDILTHSSKERIEELEIKHLTEEK